MQQTINTFETDRGTRLLRFFIFLVIVCAVFGLYARTEFRGLAEGESMEYAAIAANLSSGRGYTSYTIRPADLWLMEKHSPSKTDPFKFQELRREPLYPAILAAVFKITRPSFKIQAGTASFEPERRAIVPLGILLCILAGGIMYGTGRLLFDRGTAFFATALYFLTDAVLGLSISGSPWTLAMLLGTGTIYSTVLAARYATTGKSSLPATLAVLLAGALCALAFLTKYAAIILLPVICVLIYQQFESRRWTMLLAGLLVFAIVTTPWLARNKMLTGKLFGIATMTCLNNTVMYEDDSFDRDDQPALNNARVSQALKHKLVSHSLELLKSRIMLIGGSIITCFFLVSFFHQFDDEIVNTLRWSLLIGIITLIVTTALYGPVQAPLPPILMPLVILYGTAFFFVMLDRIEFIDTGTRTALTWIMAVLVALPSVINICDRQPRRTYPPYYPPLIAYVCDLFEPHQLICSDIPWATAWYGGRPTVLNPRSPNEFSRLNNRYPMTGIYLTTATDRNGAWRPAFSHRMPEDFPLQHGIALPPGTTDQILLTDPAVWNKDNNQSQ